ncbi:MAG: hypothetical protein HY879_03705 [Deltaproteobacteria bacterium]|nr:hypothetical protein [Deltaproteobacteria bacterium]
MDALIPDSYVNGGFIFLSTIPAFFQYGIILLKNLPLTLASVGDTSWVPALFLSTASVASIGLIYAVSRKKGAGETESLLAAFLMAISVSMLYYSRHLFSYDLAMALGLLALWLGLNQHWNIRQSVLCGLLAFSTFWVYNGYWLFALTSLVFHTLSGKPPKRDMIKRGVVSGFGFILPIALLTLWTFYRGTTPFITKLVRSSQVITQGDFSEGWSLPWVYLWQAEHGLLFLWGIGIGIVLWLSFRDRHPARERGLVWVGAVAGIYLFLFFFSSVLEKMVVYGRLARQMVPFLCLSASCGLTYFVERYWPKGKNWMLIIFILILIQTAINFAQPFNQRFPVDIQRRVKDHYGEVALDLSIKCPPALCEKEKKMFLIKRQLEAIYGEKARNLIMKESSAEDGKGERCPSPYVLVNAQYLYPVWGSKTISTGETLLSFNHPLQYLPYQYEGYTPKERSILRSTDISMRLIDTRTTR